MTNNINEVTELDWDSALTEDSKEFTLLPDGEYDFHVEKFERAMSKSGNKMAKLTLVVTDGKNKVTVFDNIVLISSMVWKISSFFGALGMKKRGETVNMNWNEIYGKIGRCNLKLVEYDKNDGSKGQRNEIEGYIYKEDVKESNTNQSRPTFTQPSFPEEKQGFSGNFNFGEFKGN